MASSEAPARKTEPRDAAVALFTHGNCRFGDWLLGAGKEKKRFEKEIRPEDIYAFAPELSCWLAKAGRS